jgi:gluconokinase
MGSKLNWQVKVRQETDITVAAASQRLAGPAMLPMPPPKPNVIVLMGVSGSGKTTVGTALATILGCSFHDADNFHPPASVEKMRAGVPLDDNDRWPWLHRLAEEVVTPHLLNGVPVILACSALKPAYREVLRCKSATTTATDGSNSRVGFVGFVLLDPGREELVRRLEVRTREGGHFMPPSLLDSQLEALDCREEELFARVAGDPFPLPEEAAALVAGLLGWVEVRVL